MPKNGKKPAQGKKKAQAKAPAKQPKAKQSRPMQDGGGHAALLYNPCTAMLSRPSYADSGTGLVVRLRAVATYGTGVGVTAGALHWAPGLGRLTVLNTAGGATSGTCVPTTDAFNSSGGFIAGNSVAGFRTVAACVRVQTLAAEQSRAGSICLGNTVWSSLDENGTYSPDSISGNIPYSVRTPPDTKEIVWLPNPEDEQFYRPGSTIVGDQLGKSSLTVVWSGQPAAAGIRVEFFEVLEWSPNSLSGIVQALTSPTKTTMSDVLRQFWSRYGSTIKNAGVSMVAKAAIAVL